MMSSLNIKQRFEGNIAAIRDREKLVGEGMIGMLLYVYRAGGPRSNYWDYYPGATYLHQVTPTQLSMSWFAVT